MDDDHKVQKSIRLQDQFNNRERIAGEAKRLHDAVRNPFEDHLRQQQRMIDSMMGPMAHLRSMTRMIDIAMGNTALRQATEMIGPNERALFHSYQSLIEPLDTIKRIQQNFTDVVGPDLSEMARAAGLDLHRPNNELLDQINQIAGSYATIADRWKDLVGSFPSTIETIIETPELGLSEPEKNKLRAKAEAFQKRVPHVSAKTKALIYLLIDVYIGEIDRVIQIPSESLQVVFLLTMLLRTLLVLVAQDQLGTPQTNTQHTEPGHSVMAKGKLLQEFVFRKNKNSRAIKCSVFSARKKYGNNRQVIVFQPGFRYDEFTICEAAMNAAKNLFPTHAVSQIIEDSYPIEYVGDAILNCSAIGLYSHEDEKQMIVAVPVIGNRRMINSMIIWQQIRENTFET